MNYVAAAVLLHPLDRGKANGRSKSLALQLAPSDPKLFIKIKHRMGICLWFKFQQCGMYPEFNCIKNIEGNCEEIALIATYVHPVICSSFFSL